MTTLTQAPALVRLLDPLARGTGEAAASFSEVLVPYVGRQPLVLRSFTRRLLREILDDPAGAAGRYPVFELHIQPS